MAARRLADPVPDAARDAGSDEALPDDEKCCDQYDARIGEAGKRLRHGQDAGEGQQHNHQQSDRVHARAVGHEHHDRGREQEQDEKKLSVHGQEPWRQALRPQVSCRASMGVTKHVRPTIASTACAPMHSGRKVTRQGSSCVPAVRGGGSGEHHPSTLLAP